MLTAEIGRYGIGCAKNLAENLVRIGEYTFGQKREILPDLRSAVAFSASNCELAQRSKRGDSRLGVS